MWADEASGRCEYEALGVVLVVGKSTASSVAEADILVQVGVVKGEWGESQDDPLGFVSSVIVLHCYCLCCLSKRSSLLRLIRLCNHKKVLTYEG